MDPARMFMESLTPRPELEDSQGHERTFGQPHIYRREAHDDDKSVVSHALQIAQSVRRDHGSHRLSSRPSEAQRSESRDP